MKHITKHITLILAVMFMIPCVAMAGSSYIEGKIQGASYVFNKTVQATSAADPKVEMEREFVLQATDGKVYFMPNVPREMKVKGVNKTVRVYGEDKGDGILFVHGIMIKTDAGYSTLCNWDEKFNERAKN